MSQYKKRNMEEFENDMTEEFKENSETEEFDDDSETEEFDENEETEEFKDDSETEEFDENRETEEFKDSFTSKQKNPEQAKMGTGRSAYTSSKNGSRKTSYTQHTGSRSSKENGNVYKMPKKVNKAVLFKETAPYLVALILIVAMVAGSFWYTKLDYQNTMEQIRQIIQGIG